MVPPTTERADSGYTEKQSAASLPDGTGWWYASFHIDWPEGEPIDWYMGTLIGGEVIAPLLDNYSQEILVWRIHRRASRDKAGHRFSFIFYSTPQNAQRIYGYIQNHTVTKELLQRGRLVKVAVDDVSKIKRPGIEDTSDDHWPLSVQKSWPALIMGASRMWLELVTDFSSRSENSTGDIEEKYKQVQADVTDIWQEQGQHAVLHHLNAVYAYQPLLIRY
ncbi:MAG: hypothetical protein GWP20_01955 [Thermotogales bacterium]|nr:hypothetical protein [Thermotogales bacterium]